MAINNNGFVTTATPAPEYTTPVINLHVTIAERNLIWRLRQLQSCNSSMLIIEWLADGFFQWREVGKPEGKPPGIG